MLTISESGMVFGPFSEERVYHIEKSKAYMAVGRGVRSVEFIYRLNKDRLAFVEAKCSSPMPEGESFDEFITTISEKFVHSFEIWLTLKFMRRKDAVSPSIFDCSMKDQRFMFVLVMNGHKTEWLPPIKEALVRKMMPLIKIWDHSVIVLNDDMARDRKLIS